MEKKDWRIVNGITLCLTLLLIAISIIQITSAQPFNQNRGDTSLAIYSPYGTPNIISLTYPNRTRLDFPVWTYTTTDNYYFFNTTLRNVGRHELIYDVANTLHKEKFFVNFARNPLSLPIYWTYILTVTWLLFFIFAAFNLWNFVSYPLLIGGLITILSELSLTSVSLGFITIFAGVRWLK